MSDGNIIDLEAYRRKTAPDPAADLQGVRNIFDVLEDDPAYSELCPQCGKQMAGHFIGRKTQYLACDTCRVQMPAGNDTGWHGLLDMAWEECGPGATPDDVGEWLQGEYHRARTHLKGYRMIGGRNG